MTTHEQNPEPKFRACSTPPSADAEYIARRDRFRRAWSRQLFLDCGCSLPCRCEYRHNPTAARVDAYGSAVEHLDEHGLPAALLAPEARQLWKRGGRDRALADRVVRTWTP